MERTAAAGLPVVRACVRACGVCAVCAVCARARVWVVRVFWRRVRRPLAYRVPVEGHEDVAEHEEDCENAQDAPACDTPRTRRTVQHATSVVEPKPIVIAASQAAARGSRSESQ